MQCATTFNQKANDIQLFLTAAMLFLDLNITSIQQSIAQCIFYWEKLIEEPISEELEVKLSSHFLWACEKDEEKMLRERNQKCSQQDPWQAAERGTLG